MTEPNELLLRGGRPWTPEGPAQRADLLVRNGRIAEIGPGLTAGPDAEVIELGGLFVLPGLVDAHSHLDKTLWGGPWVPHSAAPGLAGKIANGEGRRAEFGLPSSDYASALLGHMVTLGTAHVRSHVDIDPEVGLDGVDAVCEASAAHDGRVDVELVAFPQGGLLTRPGTAELMEEALKSGGVGVVGGLDPAGVDGDAVGHLDAVFGMAERHGAKVDVHLHDGGRLGAWEIELIIERTRATGMQGLVTVSHAYAMGEIERALQEPIIEGLAEAGVSLATCANRDDPVPPLRLMHEAGANVAAGNDGVRDLWTPYGDGDMVRLAMQIAARSVFFRDEDIELALLAATYGGARALGLPSYGLVPGAPADLCVVPGQAPAEIVMSHPARSLVLKSGRVVARDGELV
ncbi:amidohydrolase [Spirillospora sp. NPDC047279]|uniref:amidohydrolase n=1 Tax=Spirillospora sp. NPDC047279 TaxID=3155478 RepID=UPI0033EABBAC